MSGQDYLYHYWRLEIYSRKEIKDIMAYLRLIVNQRDTVSLARIVNIPRRGIGPASLAKIISFAENNLITPVEALTRAAEIDGLTGRARLACSNWLTATTSCGGLVDANVTYLATEVLEQTGYRKELLAEDTVESRTGWKT